MIDRRTTAAFPLKNRPRATRAIVTKVRTGCITCILGKRRHVKCDEAKPSCQRCIKWRGHCDGYENARAGHSKKAKGETRQSTPIEGSGGDQLEIRQSNSSTPVPKNSRILVRPHGDRQTDLPAVPVRSESHRRQMEGGSVEPEALGQEFWHVMVPYLLRHRASIWYAKLAIHALLDAKYGHDQTAASYRRALRYHGIALSQLRKEVTSQGTLQSATVCCLFFVIFDLMNGDHGAAQAHASSGCRMMSELCESNGPDFDIGDLMQRELQRALEFVMAQAAGSNQDASPLEALKRLIRRWQPCQGGEEEEEAASIRSC
ncbi:Fungal Zn(2)-Cys(6) binuclear cluster domain [Geosmithia morbida]|uniref:Fungal Zn(2)-Cys(6) binuclear cluster domain n=1 Tax=Geosmithia morbida TaxID=1094350 RepID=A0A9P4Z0V7_9HYPO|nr:Fungal Zn(2)-Cys(6) binuclear cluster domain [Geosmithia morbida]KAF4126510.1 Fungal Zn(2)-Cys(6) binuclear cluster domain [Geosmithia morbida]